MKEVFLWRSTVKGLERFWNEATHHLFLILRSPPEAGVSKDRCVYVAHGSRRAQKSALLTMRG